MKTLLVAIVITLVGIIIVFFSLSIAGLDNSVAGSIAAAIVGGIPYIRESLEKEELKLSHHRTNHTVLSFEGFGFSPPRLILYGTLILFAAMQLSSGLGGIIASLAGVGMKDIMNFIGVFAFIIVFPAVFLTGRWVGRRGVSKGIVTIFLISVFARVAASLLDLLMLPSDELALYLGEIGIWEQMGIGTVVFSLIGCWGYWRGRRQRLAAYLTYLLGRVSTDTRDAIVELAYTEASRKTNTTGAIA
ncbi:MAG: hypothetical protein R3B74_02930 [Nitrospirales bacterium]|nr:hypothetical protein [Nitrospirales bacterium]